MLLVPQTQFGVELFLITSHCMFSMTLATYEQSCKNEIKIPETAAQHTCIHLSIKMFISSLFDESQLQ